jgi:hypothetical protein
MEKLIPKLLNEVVGKEECRVDVSYRFIAFEGLEAEVSIITAQETIRKVTKMSTTESLGDYELKKLQMKDSQNF